MWELARIVFLGHHGGSVGTGAGGILLGLGRIPQGAELSFHLAFSSGVMLAVVFHDLLPEALALRGPGVTFAGVVLGTAALPLLKPLFFPTGRGSLIQTGLFLGLGIAAHNFPEGLVIGAGYLASQELGFSLAPGPLPAQYSRRDGHGGTASGRGCGQNLRCAFDHCRGSAHGPWRPGGRAFRPADPHHLSRDLGLCRGSHALFGLPRTAPGSKLLGLSPGRHLGGDFRRDARPGTFGDPLKAQPRPVDN